MGVPVLSRDVLLFEKAERMVTVRFPTVGDSLERIGEEVPILAK